MEEDGEEEADQEEQQSSNARKRNKLQHKNEPISIHDADCKADNFGRLDPNPCRHLKKYPDPLPAQARRSDEEDEEEDEDREEEE